jgi:hypothetical protein
MVNTCRNLVALRVMPHLSSQRLKKDALGQRVAERQTCIADQANDVGLDGLVRSLITLPAQKSVSRRCYDRIG